MVPLETRRAGIKPGSLALLGMTDFGAARLQLAGLARSLTKS